MEIGGVRYGTGAGYAGWSGSKFVGIGMEMCELTVLTRWLD